MIKELRVDYRKCFTNSALSSTAKRFSPSTPLYNLMQCLQYVLGLWEPTCVAMTWRLNFSLDSSNYLSRLRKTCLYRIVHFRSFLVGIAPLKS